MKRQRTKPSRLRPHRRHAPGAYIACLLFVGLASCATNREPAADIVTVEGMVAVRGNEPFAEYILETSDGAAYVLVFPEDAETPARLRVTGRLYVEERMGRSHAHIEVHTYEEVSD